MKNSTHKQLWALAVLAGAVAGAFGYAVTDAEVDAATGAGTAIAVALGTIWSIVKDVRDRRANGK